MGHFRLDTKTLWICLVIMVGVTGCATRAPHVSPLPPPLTEVERANIGRLIVVPSDTIPEHVMAIPAKGADAGAGRGSAIGAGGSVEAGGYSHQPLGLALGIVLAPVFAIVGAGVGAAQALPEEQVEQAEATLNTAFMSFNVQNKMRNAITRRLEAETLVNTTTLPRLGSATGEANRYYRAATDQGVESVLEVAVKEWGLYGPWSINPPLTFVMTLDARLIRASDKAELHGLLLIYHGSALRFDEWAADNAAHLEQQLELANEELAEKVVDEFFLLYMPDLADEAVTSEQL